MKKKYRKPGFGGEINKILMQNIEEGICDGSIRNNVNPTKMCVMISANFNGLMQRMMFVYHTKQTVITTDEIFSLLDEYLSMLDDYLQP